MKRLATFACLGVATGLIGGCAQTGVSDIMGGNTASVQQAQANPDLSMPPDLQLHAPSEAANYATQTATAAPATQTSAALAKPVTASPVTGSPTQPTGDVYEQNGISKVNPDGTPKTQQQLQEELRQVYLVKKRQANPNYGTVFNMGNIFSGN